MTPEQIKEDYEQLKEKCEELNPNIRSIATRLVESLYEDDLVAHSLRHTLYTKGTTYEMPNGTIKSRPEVTQLHQCDQRRRDTCMKLVKIFKELLDTSVDDLTAFVNR